ncbi:hypothetical protein HN51_065765 [Arachis hypogaea]
MGNQKQILKDPQFALFLTSRSNIDLKWQNLSVSNCTQGSKERSRIPRIRLRPLLLLPQLLLVIPLLFLGEYATPVTTMIHQSDSSVTVVDSSQNDEDAKNPLWYAN